MKRIWDNVAARNRAQYKKHRIKRLAKQKEYRKAHPEIAAAWYKKNSVKQNAARRERRKTDPEYRARILANQRERFYKDCDKKRAYAAEWRKKNRDYIKSYNAKYRQMLSRSFLIVKQLEKETELCL